MAMASLPLTAQAAAPKALINASTVSGSPSLEQQQASALGFSVDVVSGATWDSMTQAQFASYQLLIIGDPTCATMAASATSNAAVWAPVVMGTAVNTQPGNRILIGTDPVYHHFSHPGAVTLIRDGIAFAGALSGRTGVYLDFSCHDNGMGLTTLNMLSVGSGVWTENFSPPCGGSVNKIASNPAFADLHSSDLQGWGCSDHETFPQFRDDWSPLAVATDTPSHPTCGTDPDSGATVCGQGYIYVAGVGTVVTSPNISMSPSTASNPAFTDHTVTATVTQSGAPVSGQLVSFTVTGQNNGATGVCNPATCTTDASGHVTFTYHDTNGPGDDTITASFTDASGTKQQATAAKHWAVATGDQAITASATGVSATEGVSFTGTVATFTDPDASATAAEYSATIDWGDGSTSAGTVSGPTGGPFTVTGTHTYADEGSFTTSVTITDKDTASNTATVSGTATVADAALTAGPSMTINSTEGAPFAGPVGSFSDANPGATSADFTATIDWGDGSPTSVGVVSGPTGGPFTVSGSHTYLEEGTYSISVGVNDDGGSSATLSASASVADASLSSQCAMPPVTLQAYSGPTATFSDNVTPPAGTLSDFSATISWGDGTSSPGTITGGPSNLPYTVTGTHTYTSTGTFTVTTTINDVGGSTTTATCSPQTLVFAFAPGGGSFAIGDLESAVGTHVMFWGAQWWKNNPTSSDSQVPSFKGFANSPSTPGCGTNWSADPGNSTPPPNGPLPAFMGVIVTSTYSKSGPAISGDTIHIVVVQTDPGYQPNPGHPGTGTVVAQVC
jgi:hypothetical protein